MSGAIAVRDIGSFTVREVLALCERRRGERDEEYVADVVAAAARRPRPRPERAKKARAA